MLLVFLTCSCFAFLGGTTTLATLRFSLQNWTTSPNNEVVTVVPWELCDAVGSRSEAKHRNCCGSVLCVWKSSLLGRNILLNAKNGV